MKTTETITFTKTAASFTASTECRQSIMGSLQNCKESHWERINPSKARSNKENAFYHGIVLRLLGNHVDSLSKFVTQNDKGKLNYTALHRHLIFEYCLCNNRDDLIEWYETFHNKERIKVPIASWRFDKMKAKDARAYLEWLENRFQASVGKTFDEVLQLESMEIS